MRKFKNRRPRSGNKITNSVGYRTQAIRFASRTDNVVTVVEDSIVESDKQAQREGDAIIRRGTGARSDKAFHDSILWNMNVRKKWIRRMLELSDEQKILSVYLQSGKN